MTRIILVRHCESIGNTKGLFQGKTDCGISGNGETQLALLSVRCRNMKIDALYSSPLERARKTAEAINCYHNLPMQLEPRLAEIDGGDYEGIQWDDLISLYAEQTQSWYKTPAEFAAPNGETMRQVYDRVWDAVLDIVKANPQKTVCITSHGCVIRNVLCRSLGKPLEKINDVDWCDNTAISIIDFDNTLQPHVVSMNDASHIPAENSVFAGQKWWKREKMEADGDSEGKGIENENSSS